MTPQLIFSPKNFRVSENRSVNWFREYSDLKTLPFRFLSPLFWLISFSRKDIKQTSSGFSPKSQPAEGTPLNVQKCFVYEMSLFGTK